MAELYDPERTILIIGAIIVVGFIKGSFITAERMTPEQFILLSGAKGDNSFTKVLDSGGKFTFRIKQTSPSNVLLFAQSAVPFEFPSQLSDGSPSGKILAGGTQTRILVVPNIDRADVEGENEWVVGIADYRAAHLPNTPTV